MEQAYPRQFIWCQLLWPLNCSAFPCSGTPPHWLAACGVTTILNHANENVISSDSGGFISLTIILGFAKRVHLWLGQTPLTHHFSFSHRDPADAEKGHQVCTKSFSSDSERHAHLLAGMLSSAARSLWSPSLPNLAQQQKAHFYVYFAPWFP